MKKTIFALMLVSVFAVALSCSNGTKEKYMAQKEFVDSLMKADQQQINEAMLTQSASGALVVKLECYHAEFEALDSLAKLAKEAYGDNSAEYKEAYDLKVKAKESEDKATEESIKSLNTFIH